MKILVDVEERRSSVPRHLEELGIDVELAPLREGDYLIVPGRVVERKTVADLHRSIASSRLWSQIGALSRMERAYLLIEWPVPESGEVP